MNSKPTRTQISRLKAALGESIPAQRLIDEPLRLLAYGTDASFYRLIPQLAIRLQDEAEVSLLLRHAQAQQTPVTFRAAGTSLSGQAITDSVLALLEDDAWRAYRILDGGERIRLQPGIIGAQANRYLAPLGRKIGPDPASIATARIGGIAANNASGMCCGVAQNSYQTLESMRVILADGTLLDTGNPESRQAFRASHTGFLERLDMLAKSARGDPQLSARIHHKFKIKNTTGYSLNALVDYEDPIDILQHLMIGSEGTLGFIAEITYRTVPEHAHKASALVCFADVGSACRAVASLKREPVDAVEIMDRAALRSVEDQPGIPTALSGLPDTAAALLIETRSENETGLDHNIARIRQTLSTTRTLEGVEFTRIPEEFDKLWKIRKGLFPAVGAVRRVGTPAVIEDIAFPVPDLAAGTADLQRLLARYGYHNAIIFGHALEGNLHFVITPDFAVEEEVEGYRAFMDELCHMVVEKYDGSLKAEHSTGRNIAPYVELEWGESAYRLMQDVKQLFDPQGMLNPGVILNDDPTVHVSNLKPMPPVDPLVDRCIECGFCEPVCPSRNLSLTPRQRIVILREQARLKASGADAGTLDRLALEYRWLGEGTCAADGLCATRCPVGIDTGEMMKKLREQGRGELGRRVAQWVDGHMAGVTATTRMGLKLAHGLSRVTGPKPLELLTGGVRRLTGGRTPDWSRWTPRSGSAVKMERSMTQVGGPRDRTVVYFSACVTRTMGTASCDPETRDLREVMLSLLGKAGCKVVIPEQMDRLCCGMPFSSKGFQASAEASVRRLEEAVWQSTQQGRFPLLCDTSPCTARMREQFKRRIEVREPVSFILQHLLPHMEQTARTGQVALHITCSARKMGLEGEFLTLAERCAERVFQAEEEGCCGFAGDKGFSCPDLNASALSRLRTQIPEGCVIGYSNSRTCEIGLSRHSGIPYRSIAYLVDECFGPVS